MSDTNQTKTITILKNKCYMCDTYLKKVDTYTNDKVWKWRGGEPVKFCYICYLNLCREKGIEPVSRRTPCSCGGYGCDTDCNEEEHMLDELATNDL
jgi:hypothetical protein